MKLNITVDVQDIFEDAMYEAENGGCSSSLNEIVKKEIIEGVKNAISRDCLRSVEEKSKKAIEQAIDESVSLAKKTIQDRALQFTNEWLDKKTVISDKWGDPVNELTISELIKQQFDNLLERKVNSKGEFDSGYGSSMKLVNYLTGQMVKDEVSSKLKDYGRDVDKAVKAQIESGIKESVSNQFAKMVIQTAESNHKQLQALEK